jgi:hypothetical protein
MHAQEHPVLQGRNHISNPPQDEMKALQRLNTFYFLCGYLGFLMVWVMKLINSLVHPQGLSRVVDILEGALGWCSPHYNLACGVYDVIQTSGMHSKWPI